MERRTCHYKEKEKPEKGRRRGRKSFSRLILCIPALVCVLTGCSGVRLNEEKVRDISYTVTSEDRLPEELKMLIDGKKQEPFKMTYQDEGYLYICEGYGQQPTGGYSIQVDNVYMTENAIYFSSTLLGPAEGEPKSDVPSFPYIVVKIEFQDKTIVFD